MRKRASTKGKQMGRIVISIHNALLEIDNFSDIQAKINQIFYRYQYYLNLNRRHIIFRYVSLI